jgi:hypothetical protein
LLTWAKEIKLCHIRNRLLFQIHLPKEKRRINIP